MGDDITLFKEFSKKLFDEQKISEKTLDEINDYIDYIKTLKKMDRVEKNRTIQKRYYQRHKEKVKEKNLNNYYKRKDKEDLQVS
jgi:predicted nucleic acid-binding protein